VTFTNIESITKKFDIRTIYIGPRSHIILNIKNLNTTTISYQISADGVTWGDWAGSVNAGATGSVSFTTISQIPLNLRDVAVGGNRFELHVRENGTPTSSQLYIVDTSRQFDKGFSYSTTGSDFVHSGGTFVNDPIVEAYYDGTARSSSSIAWVVYRGVSTVTSSAGTCTITLPYTILKAGGVATISGSNSGGSGLDGVYLYINPNSATSFTITHDYITTTNSKTVSWEIWGYVTVGSTGYIKVN